jgi:hypothetical protein
LEVVEVTNELVLAKVVTQVNRELPCEPTTADRAATVAQASNTRGAPVSEACRQARAFVGSWTRHPAHRRVDQDVEARLAS